MKNVVLAFSLCVAAPMVVTSDAMAQGFEDLDGSQGKKGKKAKKPKKPKKGAAGDAEEEVVREIVRGYYVKGGAGSSMYFLKYAGIVSAGTALSLAVGSDFVDNERTSMAWEVAFYQGVHNGMPYEQQASIPLPPSRFIQGDTRTIALMANYEYSSYIGRRVGLGFRVGGGVMFAPLLMNREAYLNDVVQREFNLSAPPPVHENPHFMGFAGPTLEYYTKLSHFSVGIDADIVYAYDFDLGAHFSGYLKYTF